MRKARAGVWRTTSGDDRGEDRVSERPGVLISGGAGFIGSWLCERMVAEGWRVLCVDNLVTGSRANVAALEALGPARFTFFEEDICDAPSAALSAALGEGLRLIMNLACPASPIFYARLPLLTMRTGSVGTWNLLELARAHGARFLMASTSEVYGDPLVHPQTEDYTGNVNPIGPRSVYDESKRFSESLVAAYQREFHLEARIARIFNTYGPRMQINDGRVVSNFVCQALRGEGLTVYGDGSQTRSFCYVEDTVEGLLRLAASEFSEPVNIGNPDEHTIGEFAALVMEMTGARGALVTAPLPADDPRVRRPDIRRAREVLGWSPQIPLREGLARTIAWFGERLGAQEE
jgi:dTDP-glucose 4,6-dehydratase